MNSENIVKILQALNFEQFLKKHSPKTIITSESFEKLTSLQFRLYCYFLFYKLNPESCISRFKNVFPSRSVQQETEFRRLAIEYINELAQNKINPLVKLEKIPPIHYQRLSGLVFVEQMFNLALYILLKCSAKIESNNKMESVLNDENKIKQLFQQNKAIHAELIEYERKVKSKHEQLTKKLSEFKQKNNLLKNYGTVKDVRSINDQLEKELTNIEHYLSSMINRQQSLQTIMSPKSNSQSSLLPDNQSNFIINFVDIFKQFQQFVEAFKDCPPKLLAAFKHYHRFQEKTLALKNEIYNAESIILLQKQTEQKLKNEILNSTYCKNLRKQIENYIEPLRSIEINFKIY